MYTHKDYNAEGWKDYELLDSGDHKKLERYGSIIVSRPDTQAIWKQKNPSRWNNADAFFEWQGGKSEWRTKKQVPEAWQIQWDGVHFIVRLTSFKHTGIFPEQAINWRWIESCVKKLEKPTMLNLFGYTGIASVVAAQSGAMVTHVDASKQSLTWARENAESSGITAGIRYILDDSLKFAKREIRRGVQYDGIILDPPAFGRGPKGETWKIEEQLPELLDTLKPLLKETKGSFFLLNGYAAGYTAQSFMQLTEGVFGNTVHGEYGELRIPESGSGRVISAGIYTRFVR